MSLDIQSEELCVELHVGVRSTRYSGLMCLHVFAVQWGLQYGCLKGLLVSLVEASHLLL